MQSSGPTDDDRLPAVSLCACIMYQELKLFANMRRSAAPSAVSSAAKRPRFQTPFSASVAGHQVVPGAVTQVDKENQTELQKALQSIRRTPISISEQQTGATAHSFNLGQHTVQSRLDVGREKAENRSQLKHVSAASSSVSPKFLDCPSSEGEQSSNSSSTTHSSTVHKTGRFCPPSRTSLLQSQPPVKTAAGVGEGASSGGSSSGHVKYYNVMWCKMSKKKHKRWEGDAILIVRGGSVTLTDMEGKDIGRGSGYKKSEVSGLVEGSTLLVGGKEIEVMGEMDEELWKSGKCFTGANSSDNTTPTAVSSLKPKPVKKFVSLSTSGQVLSRQSSSMSLSSSTPLHSPALPGALVMPRPTPKHQLQFNPGGAPLVDVVVDPHLSAHLRPHQREGVVFLYECVMGMRDFNGSGAILADEMGLGKTLQCISLIWTLSRQGPYGRKPVVRKTIVITPGSLVKNWEREFRKWLGRERLRVFAVSTDNRIEEYIKSSLYPVMIISYEMFLKSHDMLRNANFDLVVCDEGHRLKNNGAKTTSVIMALSSRRRVVLTGTPIQNDLQEFYSIVEFCNPGVLGSHSAFKKVYEDPVVLSQQPSATEEEVEIGQTRANELKRLTSLFCLRRTQEISQQYLPPKVESVVFCRMTPLQSKLYNHLINSRLIKSCLKMNSDFSPHLVCIGALKKLCNSPSLILSIARAATALRQSSHHGNCPTELSVGSSLYEGVADLFPAGYDETEVTDSSGKLKVLSAMLHHLLTTTLEKIVIVSHYTQTLDVLQALCERRGYGYLRLDGSTPSARRMPLVEQFNSSYCDKSVFLLSSKAGGVGLNLIGASRLVLYDIDWNPANDLQAMARVWRDGQKKKVYIYRLLTTGSIEEKIYQRQVTKQGLNTVVDFKNEECGRSMAKFSLEDLKDLFSLHDNTLCDTHDLLGCDCCRGREMTEDCCTSSEGTPMSKSNAVSQELMQWKHYSHPIDTSSLQDELLLHSAPREVTFVLQNETCTAPCTPTATYS